METETEIINNPLIKSWLAEKRSPSTRRVYLYRIRKFLEYHKTTPEALLKLEPREARTLALVYQNENEGILAPNTLLGRITAFASFMDYYDKTITWKRGTLVDSTMDTKSHVFKNGDLSRMFEVGNVRDKAMLSLACSLGWEIQGFVDLKRQKLKAYLENAKQNKENFIYFRNIRKKTGVPRLGVINPLAITWCTKWLELSENHTKRQRTLNREHPTTLTAKDAVSDIFDLTGNGIHVCLKALAKKAGLKLTGKTRFHNIRKWVMSGLSRSGFNEFQIKFFVGKAIPKSDSVYLQTREEEIRERYPEAYARNMCLDMKNSIDVKAEMETKTTEIQELKQQMRELEEKFLRLIKKPTEDERNFAEYWLHEGRKQKDSS